MQRKDLPRSGRTTRRQWLVTSVAASVGATALTLPDTAFAAYTVRPWPAAKPTPSLALTDLDGRPWSLAALKGRPVLLNFWASWCEPCRAEMPTLQQVADLYGPDKLLVLAINFKEPAQRALQFAKTTGVTLPVLLDVQGKTAAQWGVKVFPTTLTLNSRGLPQQRVKGEVDWTSSASAKLIEGLLKA